MTPETPLSRSSALLGAAAMSRLASARVVVVGVGGVGSWCAEALVRTGLGNLVLVDADTVAVSNLNRQCPATTLTLGRPKVEAMAERLRAIRPDVAVEARFERFEQEADFARLGVCDIVVDAIDSVACKAALIRAATASGVQLVSSMGAAFRTDPTQVRVSRFDRVTGDGLARALRQRLKRERRFPPAPFMCVWSSETPCTLAPGLVTECRSGIPVRGSLMPVTATFGMCLASTAIGILTKGTRT